VDGERPLTDSALPNIASEPSGQTALVSKLSFEQTIARSLVHRAAINEVFLTDSAEIGKRQWAVAAMLPRSHMLFNDGGNPNYLDPLAIMEVARQVTEYVAHRYARVPQDHFLIFRGMNVAFTDPDVLRPGPEPARVVVIVNARTSERLNKRPVTIMVDGRECAVLGGKWFPLPRRVFASARERARRKQFANEQSLPQTDKSETLAEPSRVGRFNPRNVLLANAAADGSDAMVFDLVIDQSHPVFFDHPVDHVPGMVILEAARQAAVAALGEHRHAAPNRTLIVNCRVNFDTFCELDLPTRCRVTIDASQRAIDDHKSRHQLTVSFEQARTAVGTIALSMLENLA